MAEYTLTSKLGLAGYATFPWIGCKIDDST